MGGGVGRQHRRLFERARANRPSIVFIDEIDAIAGRRGGLGAHDDPVNQLLAEIDGVAGQAGVFVIGATNRPDQLDSALLRGGRLSRTLYLGLPDERGRLAMLRLHTARMPTVRGPPPRHRPDDGGILTRRPQGALRGGGSGAMARKTPARSRAGRDERTAAVKHADFEEAVERLRAGTGLGAPPG